MIAVVNRDEFCVRYKRLPIMPFGERISALHACKYVDEVFVNTGDEDFRVAVLCARVTHVMHGDDWSDKTYQKQTKLDDEFLKKHNIKMVTVPYTKGVSTTKFLKRIKTK